MPGCQSVKPDIYVIQKEQEASRTQALAVGEVPPARHPLSPLGRGRVLHTSSHRPISRLAVEEVLLLMEDENRPVPREAVPFI